MDAKSTKLTHKQQLFCEYYLQSLNATDAARKAGYSNKSEKALRNIASKNMTKANICEYIENSMSKRQCEAVATQEEILAILTKIARGELLEERSYVVALPGKGGSYVKNQKAQPRIADRVKACELLGKRYKLFDEAKNDSNIDGCIIVDIPDPRGLYLGDGYDAMMKKK